MYGTSGADAMLPASWLMPNSVSLIPFLVYELSLGAVVSS
jgi:hypothetical protein